VPGKCWPGMGLQKGTSSSAFRILGQQPPSLQESAQGLSLACFPVTHFCLDCWWSSSSPCPRAVTIGLPTGHLCGVGRLCPWGGVEGCTLLCEYRFGPQYLCSWKLPFIPLQKGCDFRGTIQPWLAQVLELERLPKTAPSLKL